MWQVYGGSYGYPYYGRTYTLANEPFGCPVLPLAEAAAAGLAPSLTPAQSMETEIECGIYGSRNPFRLLGATGVSIPRRQFLVAALGAPAVFSQHPVSREKILGLYVHEHWPYHHPYAARTWTLDDWRGYAGAAKLIGYNTVMFWPVIETMPDPLLPSDRASLEKHGAVTRMLKKDFGMRVIVTVCPNVAAVDAEAANAPFEKRHFFYCDRRVDPRSAPAVAAMMAGRLKRLEPLKEMDGLAVIDSDPGGYPGSGNADFVALLGEYRKMLNKLRPGIELLYWMHAGWAAYGRFYQTGEFAPGTPAEFADTLARLQKLNPEPWGMATGRLADASQAGLGARAIALNYGRIESEPSFPMTNFGDDRAHEGGKTTAARGVMGNAQTHCIQLPNTFAFARGVQGLPATRADYVEFANRLLAGRGESVVHAWEALAGKGAAAMRKQADSLSRIVNEPLPTGDLKGFLFGSPQRFVQDLILQLRLRASAEDFFAAVEQKRSVRQTFGTFLDAAEGWQKQHGYENRWRWPELQKATAQLHSSQIDDAWEPAIPMTGFAKVKRRYELTESMTPRLLAAMRETWGKMPD